MWNYFRLVCWANLWLILWLVSWPFRRGRENCLTWALKQEEEHGGYIIWRWARTERCHKHLRHPHFGWLPEDFHVGTQHYVPSQTTENEKLIPAFWFEGEIKQGDGDEHIQRKT